MRSGLCDLFSEEFGDKGIEQLAVPLPITADRWIAASLLQKSIRRGVADLAARAAISLYRSSSDAVWRRLIVIAFEDIGAGAAELLARTVEIAGPRFGRRQNDDERIAMGLACHLAGQVKDRSADCLVSITRHHPALARARLQLRRAPVAERIASVTASELLDERAAAALSLVTREDGEHLRFWGKGLELLEYALRPLFPASAILTKASLLASRRTRDPIVLLAPLIAAEVARVGEGSTVEVDLTCGPKIDGIPLWVFDKHTRAGRAAIRRLIIENSHVAACISAFVPRRHWHAAAATACFHADATPVSRKLVWSDSLRLERMGAEADLFRDGVPIEGATPLVAAIKANLEHLNALRAEERRRRVA